MLNSQPYEGAEYKLCFERLNLLSLKDGKFKRRLHQFNLNVPYKQQIKTLHNLTRKSMIKFHSQFDIYLCYSIVSSAPYEHIPITITRDNVSGAGEC